MKQRIYNVFLRKTSHSFIAKIISEMAYFILVVFYYVKRVFLKSESTIRQVQARQIISDYSQKPKMDYICERKDISDKQLSIIVPAYNSEDTIKECIESVIHQKTNTDYELVIVNDGSTDNTKRIVESIDNVNIRIINQENRGFSGARNRGIDEAKGKHIMFLDSDDMLVGDCIDSMMCKIEENDADIIQGSYYAFDNNHKNTNILNNETICDDRKVNQPGYPWAKIYKKELFEKIRFPLDVWFEDTIVCMLLYRLCKKMVVIDEVVYSWRLNPNGITSNARKNKKSIDHYWVMEHCLEKSKELGLPNDKTQYELVKGHLSTLMYRRLSLQDKKVLESAFVLGCEMLDSIRPEDYKCEGNPVERDLEKAFKTRNYKLWKLASFVV